MKIHINIDKKFEEIEVTINADEYSDEVEQLLRQLKKNDTTIIVGYRNAEIYMVRVMDIYSVYAEGVKVYIQTNEEEFEAKQRVYELEELLTGKFARINKSMLVNIEKISSIKVSTLGTTQIFMNNDTALPVSRTYLKALKHVLGIRRE